MSSSKSPKDLLAIFGLLVLITCGCNFRQNVGANVHSFHHESPQSTETIDQSMAWFGPTHGQPIRGVALVIHGLNFRPDKMASLISVLNSSGVAVLNLSLRGHGQNVELESRLNPDQARMDAFKSVSHSIWIKEAHRAYRLAQVRSQKQNIPLFLVGFSYGALLGGDLFTSRPKVHFDKMVLFAPAFKLTIVYGLKWFSLFPRLVIPSFSSKSYRDNAGTPMAAYNALFDTIRHFQMHLGPKLNVPTVIFIDPEDELISYRGLKRMVQVEKLTRWKIYPLQKETAGVKTHLHHLIIDKDALGQKPWDEVRTQMINHLLPVN